MTITSSTSRTQYTGNGVTTNFATGFYFTENSQVKALKTVISTGVDTELVNPTDFSVTGALNPSGGTVTCVVAPLGTERLTIYRTDDFVQEVNLTAYENFPAETVEDALDKLTIQTTQLLDATNRSLQFSEGSTVSSAFTIETPIANRGLKYNASGTGIINTTDDPDGIVAAAAASASAAASSASSAATSAGTATTQAGIATTQASNASTSASSASTSATNASNSASAAATSATNAENSALSTGARLTSTSTTSNSIGTGTKTWTTQTAKAWAVGMYVIATRTSDATQFMTGQVTAYDAGTGSLSLSILAGNTNGSGTYTDWTFSVSGLRGQSGTSSGQVLARVSDTTLGYLDSKITVSGGLSKSITNPSGNEIVNIAAPPAPSSQTFTASGTWNKPAGANMVRVQAWGAGGGGGAGGSGATQSGGAGGGGGAYVDFIVAASVLGASETVTIGAGGSAGGSPGGTGGDTTFGTWLTARGGTGGTAGGASSTTGGRGGGNTTNAAGDTKAFFGDIKGGNGASTTTAGAFTAGGAILAGAGGGGGGRSAAGIDGSGGGDTAAGLGGAGSNTSGGVGANGVAGTSIGGSGGGGGGHTGGTGGTGGNGAIPAGGGGGGGAGSAAAGGGGTGARGEIRVTVW